MCEGRVKEDVDQDKRATPPKVSIGMPVYNEQNYIRGALDSLLAQTFTDFELIISDNGSTDGTEVICREYLARDSRIRYVRQPENRGVLFNFQYVLDDARGDYFMWAAADDMWATDCLAKWVAVLNADDGVSLVFSNYEVFSHETGHRQRAYVQSAISRNKNNRLLVRMLNPVPNLVYGMFRTRIGSTLRLRNYDFFDLFWGYFMALQGIVFICSDFHFFAGIKGRVRTPHSITGTVIRPHIFLLDTLRLINYQVNLLYRPLFYLVLLRQVLSFWNIEKRACNSSNAL